MIVALSRHRDRGPRAAVGDLDALDRAPARHRRARRERRRAGVSAAYDPGRERRAEQRARELLKSCVNEEEWAMYRDLGFLRVWGGQSRAATGAGDLRGVAYAYLVYPHKPIVAYLPQTGQLLNEYCVEFPDETRPYGSPRLPDSDDVLAKWMALKGDERRLIIAEANLHLPGRQVDPRQVQRDLWRLGRWERERLERARAPARRRRASGRDRDGMTPGRMAGHSTPSTVARPHRGPQRAAARAYLHGIGFDAEALAKPIIGVASTWIETMPCNFHLRALAARSRRASARPAARRWSSTRSPSPTASRWARRG